MCRCYVAMGSLGCPTNETNRDGLTPQKIAKNEGMKDAMKELKRLTNFQDKVARGGKAKGYSEPWCVRVRLPPLSLPPFPSPPLPPNSHSPTYSTSYMTGCKSTK